MTNSVKQPEGNSAELEHWLDRRWRPAMAWMYLIVCITDFILFPILWSILQANYSGSVMQGWEPLTLKGGGMFHMALGAVLGVAAWTRGQEKIERLTYRYPPYEDTSRHPRKVPQGRDPEL